MMVLIKEWKKRDRRYFPISKEEAFLIANRNDNLKTDYCRETERGRITYLYFSKKKIRLVCRKGKIYWLVRIVDGDISGMEINDDYVINWDGFFGTEDEKKLRCLIDVYTGEYIYYPK